MAFDDVAGTPTRDLLVIGGGIAGLTAALEAADAGCEVVLVEKTAFLGGRVARAHQYFPKLCPPSCGLEINFRRLRQHARVAVQTLTSVQSVTGGPGDYTVVLRHEPRYVTDACTACGDCVAACPTTRKSEAEYGWADTTPVALPPGLCFPAYYAIDRAACPAGCQACVSACRYRAIELDQQPATSQVRVAAIVAATGWAPYDARRIDTLGFGRCANVITNVMMERLAARDGPTAGRIVRPSDRGTPRTVAFAQCAGSRDENHLPYCSAVCCAATLKQASYVRAACPEAAVKIFYIDIRTPGRLEALYARMAADPAVELVKGKVARVDEDPATRDVLIEVEEVLQGHKRRERVDLLVLATGVVPQTDGLPTGFATDEFHFITDAPARPGMFAAGCARQPADVTTTVRDATGAALKALQCAVRSRRHG
jgi:quinone-modifying oxidoreductase subunit QmoA